MNTSNVDLLIGTNNADLLLQRDFRKGETNETLAIKTCLKWMLMGVYSNSSNRDKAKSYNHITKVSKSHYLKILNVFGKLNHMEPFQSWVQIYCLLLNSRILEHNTILENSHFETPFRK